MLRAQNGSMVHNMVMDVRNSNREMIETRVEGASLGSASTVLVLIHGFGTNLHERGLFDDLSAELQTRFPSLAIVRFSWSGFGKSEGNQEETTLQKVSDDFGAVLSRVFEDKLKFSSVVVAGFSMGNIVISNVLASLDYKVDKVINISPADFNSGAQGFQKWLSHRGSRLEDDILVIPRTDGTVTRIHRRFWDTMDAIGYRGCIEKVLSRFPSTLIRATDDQVVDNSEFKSLNFSKVIELSGGHNFSSQEGRAQFLSIFVDLLNEKNTVVDENDNIYRCKSQE